MVRRPSNRPMPLIMLEVPRDERRIFEITGLLGYRVYAESLRRPEVNQCHRCQGFGHSQSCCYEIPRCVKCGQNHFTAQCTRPKKGDDKTDKEPPKCVNCGEVGHPANYSGCKMRPRSRSQQTSYRQGSADLSYANATKSANNFPPLPQLNHNQQTSHPAPPNNTNPSQNHSPPPIQDLSQFAQLFQQMESQMNLMRQFFFNQPHNNIQPHSNGY